MWIGHGPLGSQRFVAILVMILLTAACGGGGSGSGGGATPNTAGADDTHSGPEAGIGISNAPRSRPIMVLATSEDASTWFPEANVSIGEQTQQVFWFDPLSETSGLVRTNSSPDYAKNRLEPYAVDDRFFLVTAYGSFTKIEQIDPESDALVSFNSLFGLDLMSEVDSCFAIADDDLFFQDRGDPPFAPPYRRFSVIRNLSTGASIKEELISAYDDPDHCRGNLRASEGELVEFRVSPWGSGEMYTITFRNTISGRPEEEARFAKFDRADDHAFAYEYPYLYVARYFAWVDRPPAPGRHISIVRYNTLQNDSGTTVYSDLVPEATGALELEVRHGSIALHLGGPNVLWVPGDGSQSTVWDLGVDFYALELVWSGS